MIQETFPPETGRALSVSDPPPYTIAREAAADAADIEALYDEVFGPGRFAKTAERLREGNTAFSPGCFVARDALGLVGVVRLWPVRVGGAPLLMLGPFAVAARRRRNGVGWRLIEEAMKAAEAGGFPGVFLVGDPAYYARAGFIPAPAGSLRLPGPVDARRVLVRACSEGALEGVAGAVTIAPDLA